MQKNFYQIIKDIFPNQKNNLSLYLNQNNEIFDNELEDINEDDYSDNESLNELNDFENEIIQMKSKKFDSSENNTVIIESIINDISINSKTRQSKSKLKRNSICSNNSKTNFTDLNEFEYILVFFKINNEVKNYFYTLLNNYLFLFNNKRIKLIPLKRLFLEENNIDKKQNKYYNLEFTSCINDLNVCFYFEDKYKLSMFIKTFQSKQNLL